MTSYFFIKQVNYPLLLQLSIIAGGLVVHHIDTIGSGQAMEVLIWFNAPLSSEDQGILADLVSSFTGPADTSSLVAMVTASLADDAKLLTLLRARVIGIVSGLSYVELQGICTILGISP